MLDKGVRRRGKRAYGCRANHMIIRHNLQLPPAIHHSQQAQMIIRLPLCGGIAQTEPIKHFIPQQQLCSLLPRKHSIASRTHPFFQIDLVAREHEFKQDSDRLSVLFDLHLCRWVQDSKTSVDVPFVRVNPKH